MRRTRPQVSGVDHRGANGSTSEQEHGPLLELGDWGGRPHACRMGHESCQGFSLPSHYGDIHQAKTASMWRSGPVRGVLTVQRKMSGARREERVWRGRPRQERPGSGRAPCSRLRFMSCFQRVAEKAFPLWCCCFPRGNVSEVFLSCASPLSINQYFLSFFQGL